MGRVNEAFKTFNATMRTAIAATVVGGAGYAGYQGYALYNEPQQKLAQQQALLQEAQQTLADTESELRKRQVEVETLQTSVETLEVNLEASREELEQTQVAMKLLKVDQRVSELRVIDQKTLPPKQASRDDSQEDDPQEADGKAPPRVVTTVEFVETSPEGKPIGEPQRFQVQGDKIYLEYLVIKFNDDYVEQADLARGTAIALFERIFGNQQNSDEGFTLDKVGTRPTAYGRGEVNSDFEKSLWTNFWELAHNAERRKELGIRAVQGNAPFFKVQPGETYRLRLRSTGEFSIDPVDGDSEG